MNEQTVAQLPKPKPRVIPLYKLNEMIDKGDIFLDAPYQRGIVWDTGKMSDLIDSLFNNFYIPPILISVRKIDGKDRRIVIDGKQRLTSARRFLRNLIPYKDMSSETPVIRYCSNEENDQEDTEEEAVLRARANPQNFLTPSMFEKINNFEFVCVEYHNITEDDEYDIFSRVQLGKVITAAERLKAFNTPIARLCRDYCTTYHDISSITQKRNSTANLFQYILQIMYTIGVENPKDFNGSAKTLKDYVSSKQPPSQLMIEKAEKVLDIFMKFATQENLKEIVTKIDNKTFYIRALELLVFSKYITHVQRPRTPLSYAFDFKHLRDYLMEKEDVKMFVGRESFTKGYQWIGRYIEERDLRAVTRSQAIHFIDSDNDNDELKSEEYEQDMVPQAPLKRKREENFRGLAVARRGGKLPQKLRQF